jgi:hypothetical protein
MHTVPFYQPWSAALEQYMREDIEMVAKDQFCPKASAKALECELEIYFYYSMCLHFPAIQCPALFVRPKLGLLGDHAHIFTEREAAAIVASIPTCWRVDLPNVNHYTMLLHDNPPVLPPIRAFLGEMLREESAQPGASR